MLGRACRWRLGGFTKSCTPPRELLRLPYRRLAESASDRGALPSSSASAHAPAAGDSESHTSRLRIPGNVYSPRILYSSDYVTDETNPCMHTYRDVGKYFPLGGGSSEGVAAAFPGGLAGDLRQEFDGVSFLHIMRRYCWLLRLDTVVAA